MADQDAVDALLEAVGLLGSRTIIQTEAQETFQLTWIQLQDLPHEEKDNPRAATLGWAARPMKLFDAADVALKALEVHGGGDLAAVLGTLHLLRAEAQARAARLEQVKADMAARSAERARWCLARSPAERLCKQLSIDPDSQLTKTSAQAKFNLTWRMLNGVKCTEKNPRFARMKLYRAADVAERALQVGAMLLHPEAEVEPMAALSPLGVVPPATPHGA